MRFKVALFSWILFATDFTAHGMDAFTFEDLRAILLEKHPTTIAEVLSHIAASHPAYLKNHTLAYSSLSLHGSNYVNPRAIVYGPTADFIITFNGSPEQEGYGSLEVLSYSPENGYEFRDVSFLGEKKNHADVFAKNEIEIRTAEFAITKSNPKRCRMCHDTGRALSRPFWQPFKLWPGVYGSFDDHLFRYLYDAGGKRVVRGPGDGEPNTSAPLMKGRDTELEGFESYLRNQLTHSRYRYLPFPNGPEEIPFAPQGASVQRPNLALNQLFSYQASEQLLRTLDRGDKAEFNLTLLAAAYCVAERTPESPSATVAKLIESAKDWRIAFADDIRKLLDDDYYNLQIDFGRNLKPLDPKEHTDVDAENGRMYYLAAAIDLVGATPSDFAVNHRRMNDFDDGAGGLYALRPLLLETLRKKMSLPEQPDCVRILEKLR